MEIGLAYEINREALDRKIKSGEGIKIIDLNAEKRRVRPVCYLCDKSIRGDFKILIETTKDNKIIDKYFLHNRCYQNCLEQESFAE